MYFILSGSIREASTALFSKSATVSPELQGGARGSTRDSQLCHLPSAAYCQSSEWYCGPQLQFHTLCSFHVACVVTGCSAVFCHQTCPASLQEMSHSQQRAIGRGLEQVMVSTRSGASLGDCQTDCQYKTGFFSQVGSIAIDSVSHCSSAHRSFWSARL